MTAARTARAFILAAALMACRRSRPIITPAASPPPPPVARPNLPPDTATASQILDDFHSNQIDAETKYNGHDFHVYGVISAVRQILGAPVLELRGTDQFGQPSDLFTLNAFLARSDTETASRMSPGDTVLLRCSRSDKMGTPYVSECVLENWQAHVSNARPAGRTPVRPLQPSQTQR